MKAKATLVGTPLYMSPEILRGSLPNEQSDIWAFGCTVLEMATNEVPYAELFAKKKSKPTIWRLLSMLSSHGKAPAVPDRVTQNAPVFADFLSKCLDVVPSCRPTAAALLAHPFLTSSLEASTNSNLYTPLIADGTIALAGESSVSASAANYVDDDAVATVPSSVLMSATAGSLVAELSKQYATGTIAVPSPLRNQSPPLNPSSNAVEEVTKPNSLSAKRRTLCSKDDVKFTVVKTLGQGTSGVVKAVILNGGDGGIVAMKEIMIGDETIRKEIEKEIDLLKDMHDHGHIVEYYGSCAAKAADGSPLLRIFMEMLPSGSLADLAKMVDAPLHLETVRSYTAQVVDALAFIHERGIAHRDVKGDNVLVTQDGVCKLADFGSARAAVAGQTAGAETLVGSPLFMAPELLSGILAEEEEEAAASYGMKVDVWSLGITVLELLNRGQAPWPDFANVAEAFAHIASEGGIPQFPKHLCDDNGEPKAEAKDCYDFVQRCCARDPRKRATSSELASHPWLAESSTSKE